MNEYVCWICMGVTAFVVVILALKALFWASGVCDRFQALEREAAYNEKHREEWTARKKWDLDECVKDVETLRTDRLILFAEISALKSKQKGGKS